METDYCKKVSENLSKITKNADEISDLLAEIVTEEDLSEFNKPKNIPIKMPEKIIEILKECRIENNIVFLPNFQLDRNEYVEIKRLFENNHGKWNKKSGGFVFDINPQNVIDKLINGEKINSKKDLQFFETPDEIADLMVSMVKIQEHFRILEPSAGQGAIIRAIHRKYPWNKVDFYEISQEFCGIINQTTSINIFQKGFDFLESADTQEYDVIIANPPFRNNQDIEHIYHMYKVLRRGGILVSVASLHWKLSKNKKETEFREWLENRNAEIIELNNGDFKASGTMTKCCIIKITK